jgi:large subunit ribosomal protein L31e
MSKKPKKTSKKKEKPAKKKKEVIEEEEVGVEEESAEPAAPARLEEMKPEEIEREGLEAKEEPEPEVESEKPLEVEEGEKVEAEEPAGKVEPLEEVEAEKPEEEEEGLEIVEEKFYDLNLRRIWTAPREKRTPRAVRYIRDFAARRMNSDEVSISEETNQLLWARGISKPPRHVRLRVVKDKDDRVIVFPAEPAKAAVAPEVETPSAPKSEDASEE